MGQPKAKTNRPVAVVISDVHFTLATLEEATAAFKQAIDTANKLRVPLIDCGDITHDKALLRAEVVNRLIELRNYVQERQIGIVSLVGNHSLLNEKSTQANALDFLSGYYWKVVAQPSLDGMFGYIPYQPKAEDFYEAIEKIPKDYIVFGHQGTLGGQMGDYIQDPSKIDPTRIKDWRVFLGHYHKHYDLENTVSIGNPYTLSFGEANDPEKGFLIVYEDGSYRRQLTGLRRHVIWERDADELAASQLPVIDKQDLLWLKLRGTASQLASLSKEQIAKLIRRDDFKLDKIPTETPGVIKPTDDTKSQAEIMDGLVDALNETDEQKQHLKQLWREALKECA